MVTYSFYSKLRDDGGPIGILPERRKNRRRITKKSIMKWGKLIASGYVDPNSIYFARIEEQKAVWLNPHIVGSGPFGLVGLKREFKD